MSEQDHALYRDVLAARAQEPFKQSRRLVELHARRASAPLAERAPLHEVAVAVELAVPPGITDAVHGGVEMFPLDGDQPQISGNRRSACRLTCGFLSRFPVR